MGIKEIISIANQEVTPPSAVIKGTVDLWLDGPIPGTAWGITAANTATHLTAALASSAAVGQTRFQNGPGYLGVLSDTQALVAFLTTPGDGTDAKSDRVTDALNEAYKLTADCNIDGIPIRTSKMTCDRQIQVSDSTVITQSGKTRNNLIVNATPKGRTIQITGYLLPMSSIDHYYLIKPSLYFQIDYLDAMATSRRPIWFKDRANRFYRMQITNFHYDDVPEASAAVPVTISMQEYVTIDTDAITLGKIASYLGTTRKVGI